MTLGAPVIASNVSSIPEIVADTSFLVDPYSVEQIASAMEKLQSDPALRDRIKQQVVRQASTFNWRSAAQRLLECYQRVAQMPALPVGATPASPGS
jgi:glycosyltransferase involved in cell wall biosynthesis